MKNNTYQYVLTALGAAVIAVLAQVSIPLPFSPVPITGQTLAIGLIVTILGTRLGTLSVLLYLLLGAVGLPVFAQFKGGVSILVGPTGGYLVGFLLTALVMGLYLSKFGYTYVQSIIANIIGMFITLAFGTAWLKIAADMTWEVAINAGATPFIFLGIVKGVIAAWLGIIVRQRLQSAKLLPQVGA